MAWIIAGSVVPPSTPWIARAGVVGAGLTGPGGERGLCSDDTDDRREARLDCWLDTREAVDRCRRTASMVDIPVAPETLAYIAALAADRKLLVDGRRPSPW